MSDIKIQVIEKEIKEKSFPKVMRHSRMGYDVIFFDSSVGTTLGDSNVFGKGYFWDEWDMSQFENVDKDYEVTLKLKEI